MKGAELFVWVTGEMINRTGDLEGVGGGGRGGGLDSLRLDWYHRSPISKLSRCNDAYLAAVGTYCIFLAFTIPNCKYLSQQKRTAN